MPWILVSERPPEVEGWYLTLTKRSNGTWNLAAPTLYERGVWYTRFRVVYWMPIPEMPKEVCDV